MNRMRTTPAGVHNRLRGAVTGSYCRVLIVRNGLANQGFGAAGAPVGAVESGARNGVYSRERMASKSDKPYEPDVVPGGAASDASGALPVDWPTLAASFDSPPSVGGGTPEEVLSLA